jgi:uncharacterized protein YbjT (DUF2867 family)
MALPLTPLVILVAFTLLHSSIVLAMASSSPRNVLVTGAAGQTGKLVMKKLLERSAFDPIGVVRTESSKEKLVKEEAIPESKIVVADIGNAADMEKCCNGMDALIICTSATPAPTGEMTPEGRPVFGFPNGQPEQVDWIGQKNQIDAAKKVGMDHVVICSSMGGTNPENPLNKLGRSEDGKTGGNILLWKRKAEKYLIDSGLTYTVIHPAGLLNDTGGKRELVVGIDDQQLETENRSIPRADVAELLIASLEYDSYKNRSFDARSKPEGEGEVTKDFEGLLKKLAGNCDYSLGVIA